MGCLLVPFKLIGFLLELRGDALVDGWCYLMRRILPEKEISQKARFLCRNYLRSVFRCVAFRYGCGHHSHAVR